VRFASMRCGGRGCWGLGWELEGGALRTRGSCEGADRWWGDYELVVVEVVGIASIVYVEGRRIFG